MVWQGYNNEGCMPGDRERFERLRAGMSRYERKPNPATVERARLERSLIEKCSAYCKGVLEVEKDGYPRDVNEWHVEHSQRQTEMIDAYKALESHEAKQK